MNINDIVSKFEGRSTGQNKWQVKCPAHDDNKASLSITYKPKDKRTVLYCHAGCDTERVVEAVGLNLKDLFDEGSQEPSKSSKKEIEQVYAYQDKDNNVVHEKVRYTNKEFRNRHMKDNKYIWNLKDVNRVVYNLPNVIGAIKDKENIYLVEGEKDADTLIDMGLVATTNLEGAGKGKFKEEYIKYFQGANVIVIQDNDQAGHEMTQTIVSRLFDVVESIKEIDLGNISKAQGFDITDYFTIGYTKEEFIEMVNETPILRQKKSALGKDTNGNSLYNNYNTQDLELKDNIWYEVNEKTGKARVITGILADHLAHNIPAIYVTGRFYIYNNGCYNLAENGEEKTIIMNHIIKECRGINTVTDISSQWKITQGVRANPDDLNPDDYILNLENGLYNIKTKELIEHSPEVLSTIQLKCNYDTEATGKVFHEFIDRVVPDKENQILLQEIAGYIITGFNNAKKVFILTGKTDTGKSTFLNIFEEMLTNKNISNIPLQNLGDRFSTVDLFGKTLNIGADLPSTPITESSTFKALTGGDKISAERKGQDIFSFKNKAKLIFSCNRLPENYGDKSNAFYNRLILLPFNQSIPIHQQDRELGNKLNQELDYILQWALKGLERLISNGFTFTENQATTKLLDEYRLNANSVLLFVHDVCLLDKEYSVPRKELFNYYQQYCENEGMKPLKNSNFQKEITENFEGQIQNNENFRVPNTNFRGFEGIKLNMDVINEPIENFNRLR